MEKENLTSRENWLYEIGDIQAQFIYHVIDFLPESHQGEFIDRQANLNNKIFKTRHGDDQLSIEMPVIEDELKAFKNDLLNELRQHFESSGGGNSQRST